MPKIRLVLRKLSLDYCIIIIVIYLVWLNGQYRWRRTNIIIIIIIIIIASFSPQL